MHQGSTPSPFMFAMFRKGERCAMKRRAMKMSQNTTIYLNDSKTPPTPPPRSYKTFNACAMFQKRIKSSELSPYKTATFTLVLLLFFRNAGILMANENNALIKPFSVFIHSERSQPTPLVISALATRALCCILTRRCNKRGYEILMHHP